MIPDAFPVAEPHTQPAPKPSNALALAGIGGLLALVVLIVVLVRGGNSGGPPGQHIEQKVNVSVNLSR